MKLFGRASCDEKHVIIFQPWLPRPHLSFRLGFCGLSFSLGFRSLIFINSVSASAASSLATSSSSPPGKHYFHVHQASTAFTSVKQNHHHLQTTSSTSASKESPSTYGAPSYIPSTSSASTKNNQDRTSQGLKDIKISSTFSMPPRSGG